MSRCCFSCGTSFPGSSVMCFSSERVRDVRCATGTGIISSGVTAFTGTMETDKFPPARIRRVLIRPYQMHMPVGLISDENLLSGVWLGLFGLCLRGRLRPGGRLFQCFVLTSVLAG